MPKLGNSNPLSGMRARLVGGLAVTAVTVAFLYLGGTWFLGLSLAAGALAWWEYERMMRAGGYQLPTALGLSWVLALIGLRAVTPSSDLFAAVVIAGIFVMFVWSLFQDRPTALNEWCFAVSGALYLGLFLGYFPLLRNLDPYGAWLGLAIGMTACNDMGAFFVGRRFGQHKLWPRLSPKKTWEGAIGGLLVSILAGPFYVLITVPLVSLWLGTNALPAGLSVPVAAFMGLLIGVIAPLGDLSMSFIKRNLGVKDAGHLIPGHGGILDRIDSWIVVVPLVYYVALWLGH